MAKEKEEKVVYKFKSDKLFYYVGELGVQFINGGYETSDIKIAQYLRKLEDIKEVK